MKNILKKSVVIFTVFTINSMDKNVGYYVLPMGLKAFNYVKKQKYLQEWIMIED